MHHKTKHILVIRLSAMGDVAMTVPVIRALLQQHPNIKITLVSRPFFKPFFDKIDNVSFFEVDLKRRHKGFLGLMRLFLDLKKLNIDAVADLHNVLRSKIIRNLFAVTGKKTAATNKGRAEKKALVRFENKIFKPLKTMFQRHIETFKKLGIEINVASPNFPKKVGLSTEIKKQIGYNENENLIGIAPFAQYESKVYPNDLMQQVIIGLAKNSKNKLLLFGGGTSEIEVLNQLSKNIQNAIVIAGTLNLTNELQLISNLKVMLAMDSGNAHIAAMLGVPVITLWGATHPFAGFSPFNQPIENGLLANRILYPLLPTSIYGNKKVTGYEQVMRTITPQEIVEKINSILYKQPLTNRSGTV